MTSSTRHSDRPRPFFTAVVLAFVGMCFVGSHMLMEGLARHAEVRLGAYTWWQEEYLQLFSPTNYIDRGNGRLLMYGPSESREAFLPEVFEQHLSTLTAYQNSQSIGTIEDFLVVLDYIEQAYGPAAMPEAILLGITTRFVSNIRSEPSPLYAAINRYSPRFNLDESTAPPALVPKTWTQSFRARLDFRLRQQRRYRSAIRAIVRDWLIRLRPELADNERLRRSLTPSKYHHLPPRPKDRTKAWIESPDSYWALVHAWDPARARPEIENFLGRLASFAERNGTELYVVNMPELSWVRVRYLPGRYEDYLAAVQSALGRASFLNLRTFLADEKFYDSCHPTRPASVRISRAIAEFIAERRQSDPPVRP